MNSKMVDIKTRDGVCDAYISFPDGGKDLPGVLLYMDAIGLRQRIYDMADQLAARGYCVLAPNLFYRSRRAPIMDYAEMLKPEKRPEMLTHVRACMADYNPDLGKRDAEDFLQFIHSLSQVNARPIGTVGYCMGGGQALRAAANFPNAISAVASFHAGNLATDDANSPDRLFSLIKADVFIGHADQDASMPPEQIEKVQTALQNAKAKSTAEIFTGCHHGWTMKDLPAYNAAGEQKHWDVLFKLFDRCLKEA